MYPDTGILKVEERSDDKGCYEDPLAVPKENGRYEVIKRMGAIVGKVNIQRITCRNICRVEEGS